MDPQDLPDLESFLELFLDHSKGSIPELGATLSDPWDSLNSALRTKTDFHQWIFNLFQKDGSMPILCEQTCILDCRNPLEKIYTQFLWNVYGNKRHKIVQK